MSKAQKRRERKEQKEKERLLDIEKQEEENKLGQRHLEAQKLKELLKRYPFIWSDICKFHENNESVGLSKKYNYLTIHYGYVF